MMNGGLKIGLLASSVLGALNTPAYSKDLLVFAAASLNLPLQEIADRYQSTHKQRVRISFASSSTLARQISKGAPADIYVSANTRWMAYLAKQNETIASTKREMFSNALVLAVPNNGTQKINALTETSLTRLLGDGRLAIGDPDHVPLGIYAAQALKSLGLWKIAQPRLARLNNAQTTLAFVGRGETPAGILYRSDTHGNRRVEVMYQFPASSHPRISYIAALTGAAKDTAPQKFFANIFSPAAKDVFKRHGFLVK